jgi:glucans biosynthesis protein C
MNERKYYVDWLRVFAMITVLLFHCSRFFDNQGWHLKAPIAQQSDVLPTIRELFISLWFMELFFFVSGYAAWYALKKRTGGQYLVERIKRLLIPLYSVGLFILLVPQVYFDRFTKNIISGTFWQWLPGYFRGLPGELFGPKNYADPIELLPYNFGGHLWFIMMLFLISLAALPVILYLKSGTPIIRGVPLENVPTGAFFG